jgi:hypothetical protein
MNTFSARSKYLFVLAVLAAGCGGADSGSADGQIAAGSGAQPAAAVRVAGSISSAGASSESNAAPSEAEARASGGQWQKLSMIAVRDNRGRIVAEAPYPAGWELKTMARAGEPSITGPNGVVITDQPGATHIYVTDPRTAQLYHQTGQALRRWPGAEQLVMQDFVPAVAPQGWKLKNWYEVPEVATIDQWYNDQLYKAVPMQNEVIAIGTEWEGADGSPAFMITHVTVSTSATMQNWSHYSSVLKADREHFEMARKQYLFSLANTRYALEPIAEYNRMEAEKAGRSWAEHNARMARNQAAFEARQRDFVNRSNAINDSIMAGWRSRDAASDRQQAGTIDSIREEENSFSASGDQHKTSIHYNNYWLSSDGRYLSTNQNDYDPNRDDGLNSQSWEKLRKEE